MPTSKAHKPVVSRETVRQYRKEGLDVETDGKVDPEKIAAIHAEKMERGRLGTSRSDGARYWDEKFREAKAKRAQMELAQALKRLVDVEEVQGEWRGRCLQLRALLTGMGREIAPRLVGKSTREIQAIIDVRHFEILRVFAHQDYQPVMEPNGDPQHS
ncbi:hypothetical protein [Nitrospira sp. Nam74]